MSKEEELEPQMPQLVQMPDYEALVAAALRGRPEASDRDLMLYIMRNERCRANPADVLAEIARQRKS